jgi:DNA polymerase III epsilon subunit-like protein
VNPLPDVGPVHVHGLTADDVASAPMFEEIVGTRFNRWETSTRHLSLSTGSP